MKSKKLKELSKHDLRNPRPYLATMILEEARMAVRLETFMLDCSANMKGKYQGKMECVLCKEDEYESQEHLEKCMSLSQLRTTVNMDIMAEKVAYFKEVMMIRARAGRL